MHPTIRFFITGVLIVLAVPVFAAAQSSYCPSLSQNLAPGAQGSEVQSLQRFLISRGFLATGNDTGTYGPLTTQAVQSYQVQQGIVSSGSPATNGFGAVGPTTRASILSTCSTASSVTASPAGTVRVAGSPGIGDYFAGTAHFQSVSEAESVHLSLTGALADWDQELKIFRNPIDGMYYAFTRMYIADNVFTMALVRSTDGKNFSFVGRLFNNVPGTFYDASVLIDTSVSPPRGTMVMECAPAGIEHASACISTSVNAFNPASWTAPTVLIEGCDPNPAAGCTASRYMSASTPIILNADGALYAAWSVVDTRNPPFTGQDVGDERIFTAGKQIVGTGFAGYANSGTEILPAESNIYCTSTWDCNNRNATDWQKIGGSYYLVFAGGNYYGCSRSTGTVQWGIGIARSASPLGHYEGRSTAAIMGAGAADACRITYPTLNTVNSELYLYYPYSVSGSNTNYARSKLVWNNPPASSCTNGLSIAAYPACTCPSGQIQNGSLCQAPVAPACINGLNIQTYTTCICPTGETQHGALCSASTPIACANGLNASTYPACACPAGQVVAAGQCTDQQPIASTLTIVTNQTTFWQSLYSCALGRTVSAADVSPWIALQGSSVRTYLDAYRGIFNSPEYVSRQTSNTVYVQQLYQCVLFRTPDSAGVSGWIAKLNSGSTRDQLLSGFISSAEFQSGVLPHLNARAPLVAPEPASCSNGLSISAYPTCSCPTGQTVSGGACVGSQPQTCANGLNKTVYSSCVCPSGQIQSGSQCRTPVQSSCTNGLSISSYPSCTCPSNQTVSGTQCVAPALPGTQAQRTLFAGLYTCILGRSGSDAEISAWIQVHPSTPYAAFQGFYESPEYRSKNTSDATYVASLYSCVLKRSDEAGVKAWGALMQSGTTRSEVLTGFVNSQEFQASQAAQMEATLNAVQAHGNSLTQVAAALAAIQALLNALKAELRM